MALLIYYQSPKAYKLLSELFALPSKRTIQTIFCATFGGVMYQGELLKTLHKMM